jgi:hypothetical protein
MRIGKGTARPSARRDELKVRMERMEKVVTLITGPNRFPGGQSLYPPFLVKPGQTAIQLGARGLSFDPPPHILWVSCHNTQSMVVCFGGGQPQPPCNPQSAIRNPQSPSNLVKPGQSEKRGLTVKPQCASRRLQTTRKYPKNPLFKLALLMID